MIRIDRAEFEDLARWWARHKEITAELVQRREEAATTLAYHAAAREAVFSDYDAAAAWQAEHDTLELAYEQAQWALLKHKKEDIPIAEGRLKAALPAGSWVLVGEDLAISKIVDGWEHEWLQTCDPRTPRETWPPLEYVRMP